MSLLTGFKYIGEKMTEFTEKQNYTYLIGFEESYGYLVGNHARDKDGVVASMPVSYTHLATQQELVLKTELLLSVQIL